MLAERITEILSGNGHFLVAGHNFAVDRNQFAHRDSRINGCLLKLLRRHISVFDASPIHELHAADANCLTDVVHGSSSSRSILPGNRSPIRNAHHRINALIEIDARRCELANVIGHVRHVVTGFIREPVQLVEFFADLIGSLFRCRHDGFGRTDDLLVFSKTLSHLIDAEGFRNIRRIGGHLTRHCGQRGSSNRFESGETSFRRSQSRIEPRKADARKVVKGFSELSCALRGIVQFQAVLEILERFSALFDASFKLIILKLHLNDAFVDRSAQAEITSFHALFAISSKTGFSAGLM